MRSDLNKSFYESFYIDHADPSSFEVRSKVLAFARAIRSIGLSADSSINALDVGFGGGELLAQLCKMNPKTKCAGAEFAASAVRTVGGLHPDWDLRVADAERLPFDDASFDVVICSHTLEHLTRDEPASRELKRVVKVGGHVVVGVPGPGSGDNPLHERLYTPAMLEKLFGDLQLRSMRCYGSSLFLNIYWKSRRAAQVTNIVETGQVQSSRGTGSPISRVAMGVGIPALVTIYAVDSILSQNVVNPFEVWGVWQRNEPT